MTGRAKKDSTQAVVYFQTKQEEFCNILIVPLWYSHAVQLCLVFANKFTNLGE